MNCKMNNKFVLVYYIKGPYKNSTFPPGTESIKGLYTEEYILVVREYQLGLRQYVLLPFAPFDYEVNWFVLLYFVTITFTKFSRSHARPFHTLIWCRPGFSLPWRSYFWRSCTDGSPLASYEVVSQNHPIIYKTECLRNQILLNSFNTSSRKVLVSFSTSSLAYQLDLSIQRWRIMIQHRRVIFMLKR